MSKNTSTKQVEPAVKEAIKNAKPGEIVQVPKDISPSDVAAIRAEAEAESETKPVELPPVFRMITEFARDFEIPERAPRIEEGYFGDAVSDKINYIKSEHDETVKAFQAILDEAAVQFIRGKDSSKMAPKFDELLDGFGDVAFIAINGIYTTLRGLGYSDEEACNLTVTVLERIATANLAKRQPDGTIKRQDGKVQKPQGWTAPTYIDIIEQSDVEV